MDNYGVTPVIEKSLCILKAREIRKVLGRIRKRELNRLFIAKVVPLPSQYGTNTMRGKNEWEQESSDSSTQSPHDLWHIRLGHSNIRTVRAMTESQSYGMSNKHKLLTKDCKTCIAAKHTKTLPHGSLIKQSPNVTIHADICGPMKSKTFRGRLTF